VGERKKRKKKFQIVVAQSRRVPFRPAFKLLGHTTQNKKLVFFSPFKLGSEESLLSPDTIEINSKSWFFSFLNK
jgi:hypothetical protein